MKIQPGLISALRHAYAHTVAVSITAPTDMLAARLAMRKRGSDGHIAQRLAGRDGLGTTVWRTR